MNRNFKLNLSSSIIFVIFFITLLSIGYFGGIFIGKSIISGFLNKRSGVIFTIYRPAARYFTINRLMNSNNDLERLSAYHSLLDNNMIDIDFLHERYKKEKSLVARQTIIWILGFSENFEKVKAVYDEIYKDSKIEIKRAIERSLKRNEEKYFEGLINNIIDLSMIGYVK